MAIIPHRTLIGDLLNMGDARLIVPNYQRNYDWGKDEAEDLWADLNSSDHSIYFGNIVLDVSTKDKRKIMIIDGQQRMTTICLLLVACRERAVALKENRIAGEINKKLTFTDSATGEVTGARIEVSSSIKNIFDYIIKDDWNGSFPSKIGDRFVKRQNKKVKPIYELFSHHLSSYKKGQEISDLLRRLYESFVIKIEVDKDLDVFDLFERANARGLELNAADLLKAHLFALPDVDNIADKWEEIVNNANSTMIKMLKYYWVARNGYIQKKDLFPKLKKYSVEFGPNELVDDLMDFSELYWILRHGEEKYLRNYFEKNDSHLISKNQRYIEDLYRNIEALRLFRVTQPYPLIYSAIKAYQEGYAKDKKATNRLMQLLDVIEKYHFVNNIICERVGNEIEKTYADFAPRFNEVEKFEANCKELIKILHNKKANYEEFGPRFKDLSYGSADSLALISYIFDRINNFDKIGGQRTQLFFLDKKGFRRLYNVEHFYPQSKRAELADPDIVDNIGNLLIISLHTNSKIQDRSPLEKLEILKEKESFANLPHVKEFINDFENDIRDRGWGLKEIIMRAEKLSEKAFHDIWNF